MNIIKLCEDMDWQQVALNGGPPCFHACEDGRFCGRALRWQGHEPEGINSGVGHRFVSLADLMASQLTASHAENARLRSVLIKVVETIPDRFPVPADYSIFIALKMSAKEALTPTTPNPIEQELTELRRDKQTLIDAAWHFHNCKYCGEGSSCDNGAAHGERLLAISDTASKEAKRE